MASATMDSPPQSRSRLRLESIPIIDLRLLSQSELYDLSLCSDAAFDLRYCDDIVIPKIDRSVFNESAGSRKQTYSRVRLAPSKSKLSSIADGSTGSIVSTSKHQLHDDAERAEGSRIVDLLKDLFSVHMKRMELVPVLVESNGSAPQLPIVDEVEVQNVINVPNINIVDVPMKRGRGRPRTNENRLVVFSPVDKKEEDAVVDANSVVKRGRGRPRKNENRLAVDEVVETSDEKTNVDKKEEAAIEDAVDSSN